MSAGNGSSYGRGRKPVVTAEEDPLKLVMSSFELPVGLREAAKDKAKRLSKSGDLPKMDSISAYLRGCLVDFVAAPEPVIKNRVWKTIGARLKAGTPEEIAKFLQKQPESEKLVEAESLKNEPSETPVATSELIADLDEDKSIVSDNPPPSKKAVPVYDFGDWLD